MSILTEAINHNNIQLVLELIKNHLAQNLINICDESGRSPLFLACERGWLDVAELLCSKGAHVNLVSQDGVNALTVAIHHKNARLIKLLIKYKASIYHQNSPSHDFFIHCLNSLRNPFQIDSSSSNSHFASVPSASDDQSSTQLQNSLRLRNNTYQFIDDYLKSYSVIDLYNKFGAESFIWACIAGNLEIIHSLVQEHRVSINAADVLGETALMKACEYNQLAVVEYLIENGANINLQDNHGWTALMYAISSPSVEIVRLLIKLGADIHLVNKKNQNALLVAHRLNRKTIFNYIFKAQKNIYNISIAALIGDIDLFKNLSVIIPNFFESVDLFRTCLANATKLQYFDISKYLLESIDCGIHKSETNSRVALLNWAKSRSEVELISFLRNEILGTLEHAINTHNLVAIDELSRNECFMHDPKAAFDAVCLAVHHQYLPALDSLIRANFPIRCTEIQGLTAFFEATKIGALDCIDYFLSKGNLVLHSEYEYAKKEAFQKGNVIVANYLEARQSHLYISSVPTMLFGSLNAAQFRSETPGSSLTGSSRASLLSLTTTETSSAQELNQFDHSVSAAVIGNIDENLGELGDLEDLDWLLNFRY